MTLDQIIQLLDLKELTDQKDFSKVKLVSGYVADMLSCVMTGAKHQSVWITLQAHNNIVAVASLLDLAAVIITENAIPDAETIKKANEEEIILLSTTHNSFYIVGKLWEMGLRDN